MFRYFSSSEKYQLRKEIKLKMKTLLFFFFTPFYLLFPLELKLFLMLKVVLLKKMEWGQWKETCFLTVAIGSKIIETKKKKKKKNDTDILHLDKGNFPEHE